MVAMGPLSALVPMSSAQQGLAVAGLYEDGVADVEFLPKVPEVLPCGSIAGFPAVPSGLAALGFDLVLSAGTSLSYSPFLSDTGDVNTCSQGYTRSFTLPFQGRNPRQLSLLSGALSADGANLALLIDGQVEVDPVQHVGDLLTQQVVRTSALLPAAAAVAAFAGTPAAPLLYVATQQKPGSGHMSLCTVSLGPPAAPSCNDVAGNLAGALAIGDLDGDTLPDLLAAPGGTAGPRIDISTFDEQTGTLAMAPLALPAATPRADFLAIGPVDASGDPGIVIATGQEGGTAITPLRPSP
jgi:hypothetical protein